MPIGPLRASGDGVRGAPRGAQGGEASPVPLTEPFDRAPLGPSSAGVQGPEFP